MRLTANSLAPGSWSRTVWVPILGMVLAAAGPAVGAEPDPKTYWDVDAITPGMKGTGWTVMVGTRPEEFQAEVLGVLRGVSPGRDMVLCRLSGLRLEHHGIIQGMSGSPIYIDGKMLGAVAYAWEFAKDPIAGVTPFQQMVQFVRSNDRRIAVEEGLREGGIRSASATRVSPWLFEPEEPDGAAPGSNPAAVAVAGGGLAGMRPIATPLAASGFSPRALALLGDRLGPLGMAPMAGGAASEKLIKEQGEKPLVPGAPLSIAMVTGDFDLSGIGTVTHVEGNRVYGFGHPMFALGNCEFPLMTGYIHTVYPRASVSMKMGSPLKIVGVLDTDVSTGVSGRIGPKPDLLPMSVRVKVGRYSEPRTFHVQVVREPSLLPTLVLAVLTNAIDTEGNLPDELTARLKADIRLKGHDPIVLSDTLSGQRFAGATGPMMMFGPVATIVNLLVRNEMAPARIEAIDCDIEIAVGRTVATIESVRLASDRLEPGQTLTAYATLKPFKGERETVVIELPLPEDLPEGQYEATICDMVTSIRRKFRNEPHLMEPRDLDGVLRLIRQQVDTRRTRLSLFVALPERGLAVKGQPLPNLPGSARAVFANTRETPDPALRTDLSAQVDTNWVIEGNRTLRFTIAKDTGLSLYSSP